MPNVKIRPAMHADMNAVGRLGAMLIEEHYEFDRDRFIAASPESPQRYGAFLGTQLERENIIVLVADIDGKVVGYTYAGVEGFDYMALRGPAGALYDIVVDPAFRGQGIGRMLLDATIAALKKRGEPRIVLSTAEKNETAQRLFARAGFRRTMIEMTLTLDSEAK
jgi:ribosomal protein S18 acetylase RimI-like enzyme